MSTIETVSSYGWLKKEPAQNVGLQPYNNPQYTWRYWSLNLSLVCMIILYSFCLSKYWSLPLLLTCTCDYKSDYMVHFGVNWKINVSCEISILKSLKWYQELKISQLLFIIKLSLKEFFLNCQHFYPFLDTYWKNVYNSFYSQRRAESKLINQAGWTENKITFQFLKWNLNEFYV